MITEAILDFLHGLAVTLCTFLADNLPAAADFWADASDAITTAFAVVPAQVRWFVPIGPVVVAGSAVVVLIAVLGALRLARRVLSLFTGGGGMA